MTGGSAIWVLGLSGSGKTTLCQAVYDRMKPVLPQLVLLDGDAVRSAFGNDLGHNVVDRIRQVQRMQGLSKLLAAQGLMVIVSVVYSTPELLAWNRQNLPEYFEIYLRASIGLVASRDGKRLYARARAGEISNVVGIDIPLHEPTTPDLLIEANQQQPVAAMAQQVIDAVPALVHGPV